MIKSLDAPVWRDYLPCGEVGAGMAGDLMSALDSRTHDSISHNPMSAFDCLLERLFDYAGMFPPAQRDFEAALRESASLGSTLRRPWLVASDLVLDAAHIRKLPECKLSEFGFTSPLTICALATEPVEQTLTALQSLTAASLPIRLSSIEVKIADDAATQAIEIWKELATQYNALLAIEPDLSRSNWDEQLDSCVTAISKSNGRVALKCRLTGLTGIGPDRLARAIARGCELGLPFKVTGGLHHPIVDRALHEYPMGFLNVTTAVMLKRALHSALSEPTLVDILTNSSYQSFSWENGLQFGDFAISLDQLTSAKNLAHFSIGSCSLHEPDADLLSFSDTAR
ncbi:MAG: hypothetical protein RL326_2114 [Pseudomonadota bacterium]|jgi:hypothetical protein